MISQSLLRHFFNNDLDDDDIVILDTRDLVFLLLGAHASDVKVKLLYGAGAVLVTGNFCHCFFLLLIFTSSYIYVANGLNLHEIIKRQKV